MSHILVYMFDFWRDRDREMGNLDLGLGGFAKVSSVVIAVVWIFPDCFSVLILLIGLT